jgi:hypothetical protein
MKVKIIHIIDLMYCVNITQYICISHYLLGNDMSLMHL